MVPKNRRTENNYIYVLVLQGGKNESIIVRHACAYEQCGGKTISGVQESTVEEGE
jgi:hypothetical protein